ncbi:MAG: hypothetical protein AB7U46_13740 [Paenirhodobacter sp.]
MIDLTSVDANALRADVQGWTWIAGAAFSHRAGELRYGGGVLQGDTDGDGVSDFAIVVSGSVAEIGDALML